MESTPLVVNSYREEAATNNQNKILSYLSDGLLLVGNSMIASGNFLLYRDGVLPAIPAWCFISEGAINSKIALAKLILRCRNTNNKTINSILKWSSLAVAPLLPTAVLLLNLPKPNKDTLDVTYAFTTAAVTSILNTTALAFEKGKGDITDSNQENIPFEQLTLTKKIVNVVTSVLPLITITSVITGVGLFAHHQLTNPNNNDDNKSFFDKEATAFYQIIAGLATVGLGETINTINKWKKWCSNNTSNFYSEDDSINNFINETRTITPFTPPLVSTSTSSTSSLTEISCDNVFVEDSLRGSINSVVEHSTKTLTSDSLDLSGNVESINNLKVSVNLKISRSRSLSA